MSERDCIEDAPAEVLRIGQAHLARRWDVSPRTLERWRQRGVGPRWLKIMGVVRYDLDEIERFEAEQTRGGGRP